MSKSKLDVAIEDLQKQLNELSPKELSKALRSSVRIAARKVARKVTDQAMTSKLNVNKKEFIRALKKGVSKKSLRENRLGGYVSDAFSNRPDPKPGQGQYKTRRGAFKPIPFWANRGTKDRSRKMPRGIVRRDLGHMDKYDFMSNADNLAIDAIQEIGKAVERRVALIYRKANS